MSGLGGRKEKRNSLSTKLNRSTQRNRFEKMLPENTKLLLRNHFSVNTLIVSCRAGKAAVCILCVCKQLITHHASNVANHTS